jgi:hypothetical protein
MDRPEHMDQHKAKPGHETLNFAGAQYRLHVDGLAKSMTRDLDQLSGAMSALQYSIKKTDWSKVLRQMKEGTTKLANLGWTLPISFTLQQVAELSQCPHTDTVLEQYMFEHFTRENGQSYSRLRSYVVGASDLQDWRSLLEQCFDAYNRGHYLVPIPALLSVIEGAVAKNAGTLMARDTRPTKHILSLKSRAQPEGIEFLVWHSTQIVADKLFQSCPFDGPHPGQLNRHWVLHGRDHTQWTQTDVLRLFNILGTMS